MSLCVRLLSTFHIDATYFLFQFQSTNFIYNENNFRAKYENQFHTLCADKNAIIYFIAFK